MQSASTSGCCGRRAVPFAALNSKIVHKVASSFQMAYYLFSHSTMQSDMLDWEEMRTGTVATMASNKMKCSLAL